MRVPSESIIKNKSPQRSHILFNQKQKDEGLHLKQDEFQQFVQKKKCSYIKDNIQKVKNQDPNVEIDKKLNQLVIMNIPSL